MLGLRSVLNINDFKIHRAILVFLQNVRQRSRFSFLTFYKDACSVQISHLYSAKALFSRPLAMLTEYFPFKWHLPPYPHHHPPDVLISSASYAGQISGLMMDNLPQVGTAHRHAASLWMPYGQKQLFSLLSLAQMCQTGCRLQSAVLLALGGGCFRLAWQLITLM